MDAKRRRLLRRVLLLVLVGGCLWLGGHLYHSWQQQPQRQQANSAPAPQEQQGGQKLVDFTYTQNAQGNIQWQVKAAMARQDPQRNTTKLKQPHITYYQAGRFGTVKLKAQQGELVSDAKQMRVWGDVHITTSNGYEATTQRLLWNGTERTLSTKAPVSLTGPDMQLQGRGLTLHMPSGKVAVQRVVTVIQPSSSGL